MNKLHPSGPSICFPAAWLTACVKIGFASGDDVNGEPKLESEEGKIGGVADICEDTPSDPGLPKNMRKRMA